MSVQLSDNVKNQLEQLLEQAGGRKKQSKKTSKKLSKKQKGGKRELPQAIKDRIALAKFIVDDLKVKGGVQIQSLIKIYADKVKAKDPNIDAIKLVAEAKKAYLADKPNGPHDKLKKIADEKARTKQKKDAKVGGTRKSSKKSSKKMSKNSQKW